jgi:uncharacterized repeat protein (TIGR01451 family)
LESQHELKKYRLQVILFYLLICFVIGHLEMDQPHTAQAAAGALTLESDNWNHFKDKVEPPALAHIATSTSAFSATGTLTAANTSTLGPLTNIASNSAEDFTIVVLPDTQYYSDNHPEIYVSQTQWIVDNQAALNIVYVVHEGDLVQDADVENQWINADAAMSLLEVATSPLYPDGIPYGVLPGNHDQPTTLYNQYFGVSRFQGRAYYGGHYSNKNDNNFTFFNASGMNFIVINLEYQPDDDVWAWADNLLQTYSDRRGIVVTHSLMDNQANFEWIGMQIYEALKGNPNLFLMLAGHKDGEAMRTDVFNGNIIYTLLANYQTRTNGGNGWLRILTFSPVNDQIQVKTYSPYLDQFENDSNSEFVLSYGMTVNLAASGEVSPNPVIAGNNLTYSLTVANDGPSGATGVSLTDTLPEKVTFVSATSDSNCTEAGGIVNCDLAYLAAGESSQIDIEVTVDRATTGLLTDKVTVASNELDRDPENNTLILTSEATFRFKFYLPLLLR